VSSLQSKRRPETAKAGSWIFFLTALVVLTSSGCDHTPQRYLEMAEERWDQGDYLGAVREYERIIHEYPKSGPAAEAYYWTGIIAYLYLQDPQRGLEAFSKLVSDFPKSSQARGALRYMAEIYDQRLGQPRQAIVAYQRLIAISRDPKEIAESQYRIGEVYLELGDFDQARTEWDLLLRRDPDGNWSDRALYRIGSSYFLRGQYLQAMAAFERLLAKYPQSEMTMEAKFGIASSLEETDHLEEALQRYRELEKRYPTPGVIGLRIKSIERRLKSGVPGPSIPAASGRPEKTS
jgi:TolA-binding protein